MRIFTISMLFFFSLSQIVSQNSASGEIIPNEFDFLLYAQQMANKPGKNLYLNQLNDYSNIEGSPFWFDDERIAQVVQMNGDKVNNVPILFDQYKREILAKTEDGGVILLEQSFYKAIKFIRGAKEDQFRKVHPSFPQRFFQVLFTNDDITLFKDIQVTLNESASNYVGLNDKIREFRRKTSYYILKDGTVQLIPFKKKKFFDAFTEEDRKRMKDFAKKEKNKLKSEADFVSLLEFLHNTSK